MSSLSAVKFFWCAFFGILGEIFFTLPMYAETAGVESSIITPAHLHGFLKASCIDCHDGPDGEAGFDISRTIVTGIDSKDIQYDQAWVRIIDQIGRAHV